MHPVVQYRQFAADYRRLAAMLTKPADKQAMELFATGWDRIAKNHEATLRVRYFLRVANSVLAVVRPRRRSVSDGCPTAGDGSGFNRATVATMRYRTTRATEEGS
jgi:hypothetical protein